VIIDASLAWVDTDRAVRGAVVVASCIRAYAPTCAIFVLTDSPSEEELFRFLLHGAAAYEHTATLTACDLISRIGRIVAGEYVFTSTILRTRKNVHLPPQLRLFLQESLEPKEEPAENVEESSRITGREIEVLVCVGYGLSNAQIGRRLGISGDTVKNHITHVMGKMNVYNRTAAVVYALHHGLMTCDDPLPDEKRMATVRLG
jgi:DNA-binding NarL/FixJ family response regulator